MKVTLTRTGGFGGITLKKTVDTSLLPKGQAKELQKTIQHIQKESKGSKQSKVSNYPDEFSYLISVESEASTKSISIPEHLLTLKIRHIIETLFSLDLTYHT